MGAQACYGLALFLIADKLARLIAASVIITLAFAAFTYLTWSLRDYALRSRFFWLTFGFTINSAWLCIATYVQWSSLFVFVGLPMNALQIPFLLLTVLAVCILSLCPVLKYPPAYFLVTFWTFMFQCVLWDPPAGVDDNFTPSVQTAYRCTVGVVAAVSIPEAVYVFLKKEGLEDAGNWTNDDGSSEESS